MADDSRAVRVAEDNLGAHIDKLVDEEETALEHLLMDKDAALSLRSDDEEDAEEVWSEARPRGVCYRHYRAVDKGVDLIVVLGRNMDIVVLDVEVDTHTAEDEGSYAEVLDAGVLDTDIALRHSSHADKGRARDDGGTSEARPRRGS